MTNLFHKHIPQNKVPTPRINPKLVKKIKLVSISISTVLTITAIGITSIAISNWFDSHKIVFARPVTVNFQKPVTIEKREPLIVKEVQILNYPGEVDTPIKKYICDKFGVYRCNMALAIFDAESGFREEAWHVNTNGSIDVGIAQINSVNWKIKGCSLKEIVDQYKNVDCAYTIWDRADGIEGNSQGSFTPWSTFNSGSFTSNVK